MKTYRTGLWANCRLIGRKRKMCARSRSSATAFGSTTARTNVFFLKGPLSSETIREQWPFWWTRLFVEKSLKKNLCIFKQQIFSFLKMIYGRIDDTQNFEREKKTHSSMIFRWIFKWFFFRRVFNVTQNKKHNLLLIILTNKLCIFE